MCTNSGFHLIVSAMLEQVKTDMAKATRANGSANRRLKKNATEAEEFLSSTFFENLCVTLGVSKEKALQDIRQDSNDLVANGKSSTHPWICYWREIREEKAQLAKPRNAAAA